MTEENLLGGSDLTGLTPDTIANFKTKPDVLTSGFKATDPFAGQDVYDNLTNQRYNSAPLQDIYPKIPPGVSVDAWAKSANAGIKQKLDQVDSWGADPYKAIKPFTFGTGAQHTNFARYYNHPKFNQLGFTPFRDNETFYNDNSSIVDDLIRAGGQWDNLFASTIKSGYRALGDALTGNFFTPDAQGGRELENAMNIGYSSRGGIMGGFNNLFLQSAIPVGIMVDFAFSEFALGLTGNIPGMGLKVAQTGLNVERAAEILNNTSKLRQFYDGAKKAGVATTEFFLPSTVKNLAEYGPGTGKLANFANVVGTFGDFYRDARNINYALSESKIEGGIVKNKFAQDHIAEIISNEGRNPTDEEMAKIYDYANDAGYSTTVINAPIIFASNKLIFDNLFTTPKFAARSALEAVEFGSKQGTRLVYDATKIAEGKAFRELTGAKDVLATGLKQLARPSTYVTGGINYFKANITEGLQEVTQEIISGSTEDYYNRLYTDAAKGGIDYMLGDTYSNLKKQMSAEGAEVFASGFFMGGLVSMGGRVVNTALRGGRSALNQYYKARNPEAYEKDYEADKARTKEVIDSLNELYSDPMQFFAPDRTTLVELQRLNKTLNNIRENGTDKEFIDVSDISKFVGIYNSLRLNRFDGFKDMLISYRDLSDTELKEALKLDDDVTGQEARDLLEAAIKRADKVQSNYKTFSKYENPFNPERFRKKDINTNEDIKQQYQQEALAYIGFENAKRKATFSMYGFERAKERMASITNNWSANPPVAGAAYSDFSFMFSPVTLDKEVQLLEAEILSLEGSTDAYNIQQLESKKKKLDKLKVLQNKFKEQGPQLQAFEFWASPDVRKTFLDYAKTVADINDTYYQEDQALSGINQLADFYLLKGDANRYAEDVNTLMIPQNFYQLAAREATALKKINEKKAEYIKDAVTNYENVKGTNELLNSFFDAHIVIDKNDLAVLMSMSPEEIISTLETYDDIVFINVLTNEVFTKKNTEQYKKVEEVIADYKARKPEAAEKTVETEVTEEVTTEKAVTPEAQPEATMPSAKVPTIKNNADMTRLPDDLKKQILGSLANVNSKREADGLNPLALNDFLSTKKAKDLINDFFTNPENADVVKQYWDKVTKSVAEAPVTKEPVVEAPVDSIEAQKADIERRRQKELFDTLGDKESFDKIKDLLDVPITEEIAQLIYERFNNGKDVVNLVFENGSIKSDGEGIFVIYNKGVDGYNNPFRLSFADKKMYYQGSRKQMATPTAFGKPIIPNNYQGDTVDTSTYKSSQTKFKEINAEYDAKLAALEQPTTQSTDAEADIERRRQEDLKNAVLFLINDGTYGGSKDFSLAEYFDIQTKENGEKYNVNNWKYINVNGTGVFFLKEEGTAYIVPNNSYAKNPRVVKIFFNKGTQRINLSSPGINTPNLKMSAEKDNVNYDSLLQEVQSVLQPLDAELAGLEAPATGIRSELVGKVVYASPASGKTTAAGMSENLVDGDDLLLAELKNIPGSEESSAETLAADLAFLANENKDAFDVVYSQALKKARALANEGKTVLFGSKRLINDVDVVITSESNEENNQRMVNKFIAAGQSKAGAESSVTSIRKVEKAVKDKTVISIPFDQYIFTETVAEAPVSKSYESKYDNLVAKLQSVKTLLELNEVQQEFLRQDLIEDMDKALQFDALYKQKQKELTETVNFDNVKVGDILFLGDNKYGAVVKTTNNQLTYKPLYGESLQPGKKEDQTKTIRKQDFNKAVVMMYDNQSKAVIGTKKVTKPTKAEQSLIKENVQSYQSFTDDAAAITQAETEAREQSSEDIDNDFINGLGC